MATLFGLSIWSAIGWMLLLLYIGFTAVWTYKTWKYRGIILSDIYGIPFDMNVDMLGRINFKTGKYVNSGFIVSEGNMPKRVREKTQLRLGGATGILTVGDIGMSIQPEELAVVSQMTDDDKTLLRQGIEAHWWLANFPEVDNKDALEEVIKAYDERFKSLHIKINPLESVRVTDVIDALNSDPPDVFIEAYAQEREMLAKKEAGQGLLSPNLIMTIVIIMIAGAVALNMIPHSTTQTVLHQYQNVTTGVMM